MNYHREFMPKFAEIADCLYQLTIKKAQFHWNEEHETTFNTLKKIAMSHEVLSYPTKTDSFVLDTEGVAIHHSFYQAISSLCVGM